MVHPHLVGVYGLLAADVGVGGELVYDDLVPGLQPTALYLCTSAPPRPALTHLGKAWVLAAERLVQLPAHLYSTVQYNAVHYITVQYKYSKAPCSPVRSPCPAAPGSAPPRPRPRQPPPAAARPPSAAVR